ncbi:hypothetical protein [Providencia stuartii]|uniref:hypothetical protein n=1 Tax=Providencia stuartii TaxID=588 RepID=UPI00300D9347
MTYLLKKRSRLGLLAGVMMASAFSAAQEAELSLRAFIANKGLGCDFSVTESELRFNPVAVKQLTGAVQTFQIQPIHLQLHCVEEQSAILPKLSLTGETPYSMDVDQVVFLSGTPNGAGFMVRQSENDEPIDLADFYQPTDAIGHAGKGQALTVLDDNNQYKSDRVLWVGLVGPFLQNAIPGYFHASLTLNMTFE